MTFSFLNPEVATQGKLFKGAVNLLEIKVSVPLGYVDDLELHLKHDTHTAVAASDPNLVQFCNITLVDKGANVPCVDPLVDVWTNITVVNETLLFPK